MGGHALLQGNFTTQGSNLGLLHRRQILYHWITREVQGLSLEVVYMLNPDSKQRHIYVGPNITL